MKIPYKIIIFAILLVASHIAFALILQQIFQQYERLFLPNLALLSAIVWVFLSVVLVAILAGLFVALVRPWWISVIVFFLATLVLVFVWRLSLISVATGIIYFVFTVFYSYFVVDELNNRLRFCMRPLIEGQKTLIFALLFLLSVSFAWGYQVEAKKSGLIIPAEYKAMSSKIIVPRIIEKTGLPQESQAQLDQELDKFWLSIEEMLQPYGRFIPFILGLILLMLLQTISHLITWLPPLILSAIFPLLKLLKIARVITKAEETKKLIL